MLLLTGVTSCCSCCCCCCSSRSEGHGAPHVVMLIVVMLFALTCWLSCCWLLWCCWRCDAVNTLHSWWASRVASVICGMRFTWQQQCVSCSYVLARRANNVHVFIMLLTLGVVNVLLVLIFIVEIMLLIRHNPFSHHISLGRGRYRTFTHQTPYCSRACLKCKQSISQRRPAPSDSQAPAPNQHRHNIP